MTLFSQEIISFLTPSIKPETYKSLRIDAIVTNNQDKLNSLTRFDLLLDEDTLARHFSRLGDHLGTIPAYKSLRFSQKVAGKITTTLARRYSKTLCIPEQSLIEAWFFPVWTELCYLIPIRHLARQLSREAAGDLILIKLPTKNGYYLSYWGPNALERIWLAYTLRRCGANVAIVLDPLDLLPEIIPYILRPFPAWEFSAVNSTQNKRHHAVVSASGMRGLSHILSMIANPLVVQSVFTFNAHSHFKASVHEYASPLPEIVINFVRQAYQPVIEKSVCHYVCELPNTDLGVWFNNVIGNRTQSVAIAAARIVNEHSITEAHVCDHMFFESGLVSGAVREKGGKIVLWPHSIGTDEVGMTLRLLAPPSEINCVTKNDALHWKSKFPLSLINVRSDLMLSKGLIPQRLDPSKPLTVVLINGAHFMARMPTLNYRAHEESYRRLLLALLILSPHIRITCKAKNPWETIEWLRSLAPKGLVIEEITEHPTSISLPNMIFISVSLLSAALMEGLGRGIPCMVVREAPVEDYLQIDSIEVPIGTVELITMEIIRCLDHSYLKLLIERQLRWYRGQLS